MSGNRKRAERPATDDTPDADATDDAIDDAIDDANDDEMSRADIANGERPQPPTTRPD